MWSRVRTMFQESQNDMLRGSYDRSVRCNLEILRTVVREQIDDAMLVSSSLESDIRELYENRLISQETRDAYNSIRIYGEQVEAGDMPTEEAANASFTAVRLLIARNMGGGTESELSAGGGREGAVSQRSSRPMVPLSESVQRREPLPSAAAQAAENPQEEEGLHFISGRNTEEEERQRLRAERAARSDRRRAASSASLRRSGERGSDRRPSRKERSGRQESARERRPARSSLNRRLRRQGERPGRGSGPRSVDLYDILKIILPIVMLILLALIIRIFAFSGKPVAETSAAVPAPSAETVTVAESGTQEAESMPESSASETAVVAGSIPAAADTPKRWITTDGVRVRTKPSTENSEVLDVLDPGTEVRYKSDYNEEWAIINFNGQDAYISKRYLRSEELPTTAGTTNGSAGTVAAPVGNSSTGPAASMGSGVQNSLHSASLTGGNSVSGNGIN